MSTENLEQELVMPKHLDEIKGTPSQQVSIKTALIRKFGYDAFVQMVANSSRSTKR